MKVQCDVCEKAEATVLCCADEAALCARCDDKVHAANKLAGKHQRVPLRRSSSHNPNCDICQEKTGYFFCLEDRALLCRQCDVAIHTASPYVSSHQRFLVTGHRVGLQHHLLASCSAAAAAAAASSNGNSNCNNYNGSMTSGSPGASNSSPERKYLSAEAEAEAEAETAEAETAAPVGLAVEEVDGFRGQWPWDVLFAGAEFGHYYGFGSEPGSSRVNGQ